LFALRRSFGWLLGATGTSLWQVLDLIFRPLGNVTNNSTGSLKLIDTTLKIYLLMPCKKISPFYRASAAPGEFHAESGIPDEHALRGLHFMCLSCRSPMNGWGVISEKADFVKLNLLHF
jgi:hypothetical protein